jgi:uncharacterized protein YjiK
MQEEAPKVKAARIKAYGYLFGFIAAVIIVSGLVLYLSRPESSGSEKEKSKEAKGKDKDDKAAARAGATGRGRPFEGGKFEASDVVYVPGTEGVLFVDDGKPGEVFWMQFDRAGDQTGPVKSIPLGATVENPEAITFDGSYFYVGGSQAKLGTAGKNAIVRFKFDPQSQSVTAAEGLTDLRGYLIQNVPELADEGAKKGSDDGLNIEGLAWDPVRKWLLVGLRSPLIDGQALAVPLKMRDPQGPFSYDNLALAQPNVIRLQLSGQGIRSIEYDTRSRSFLIISGATEQGKKTDFKVWEWNAEAAGAAPRELTTIDEDMKPEGITRIKAGDTEPLLIVCDASTYLRLDNPGAR